MSYQHFYSRVPARVSLYNKIDGFDTFAHSAGLKNDFIVGQLSTVYHDKLNIHDSYKIRKGEISTVYSHIVLPSGDAVHTALTYLPLDFTGERSSYLAHSIILTDEEKRRLYSGSENLMFNKDMFVTDISSFNITSPTAAPNPNLPEGSYFLRPLFDPRGITFKYNSDMIKSFLYSLTAAICGEGRDVYFRLPCADSEVSEEALGFINAIMTIMPHSLREKLSFVTYISRPDCYQRFKLKAVGEDFQGVDPKQGVFYDFAAGTVSGQPIEYERYSALANFLYSLFENKSIRDNFHIYLAGIEKSYPLLDIGVKSLSEIIFAFWQCSGYYVEQSILPDDNSVRSFFNVYGKYREGMAIEQRMKAYRCLARYSRAHIAVPADIFEKLTELYPDECVSAKAVLLDILLSLIHEPAMREEIFAFISDNYASEIDKVKHIINSNLARVFYGGYLQYQILHFFDDNFATEPEETKDVIIDKLILSIRTPEVRASIVSFLDRHYGELSVAQRTKIYNTAHEMIPECDDLALMLVNLVNRHIAREGAELQKLVSTGICESLEKSLKAGSDRLLALYMSDIGFCEDVAVAFIWKNHIGGDELINILSSIGAYKRAIKLIRMYKTLPGLEDGDYEFLLNTFAETEVNIAPATMYELMHADRAALASLPEKQANLFREKIIYPTIIHTFYDVFKIKYGKDGIATLLAYVQDKPILTKSKQYAEIDSFIALTKKCEMGNVEAVFRLEKELPTDEDVRADIAEYIGACSLNTVTQDEVTICTYELLINYLESGTLKFDTLYMGIKREREKEYRARNNFINKLDPSNRHAAADAMELILHCISEIYKANHTLYDVICDSESGVDRMMTDFVYAYGIGARGFVRRKGKGCPYDIFDSARDIVKERNSSVSSFDDFMDIFFRRK